MDEVTVVVATFGDKSWATLASVVAGRSVPRGVPVVFEHQPHGTLATCRNEGALRVETDWVCFLDADDRLGVGFVKAMNAAIGQRWDAPPLLAPAVSYVDARGGKTRAMIPNAGGWPMVNECVIGTVLRTDLFTEVGGFREWPSLEDYELWLRCCAAGAEIVHVPSAVYLAARDGGGRNSNQSPYRQIVRLYRDQVPGLR